MIVPKRLQKRSGVALCIWSSMEKDVSNDTLSPPINSDLNNGRLSPTKSLPPNATFYHRLVLANWKFSLLLNIGSIIALLIFGWIFLGFATAAKPRFAIQVFVFLINLPTFLIVLLVIMLLHELCHALVYLLFAKRLPSISFRIFYAQADKGAHYFPRGQFIMIALAPLVMLTAVGLFWLTQAHILMIPRLVIALSINAAGSIGDILIAMWLLSHPVQGYVVDEGEAIVIYTLK